MRCEKVEIKGIMCCCGLCGLEVESSPAPEGEGEGMGYRPWFG